MNTVVDTNQTTESEEINIMDIPTFEHFLQRLQSDEISLDSAELEKLTNAYKRLESQNNNVEEFLPNIKCPRGRRSSAVINKRSPPSRKSSVRRFPSLKIQYRPQTPPRLTKQTSISRPPTPFPLSPECEQKEISSFPFDRFVYQ